MKADLTGQIQASGVDATAYAARLPNGARTIVILNKDAERDLELAIDFGAAHGAVDMERLHAPAMDAREAHITAEPEHGRLRRGRFDIMVPHASGMRMTVR